MIDTKYTIYGSKQFEAQIDKHMKQISSTLVDKLGESNIESLVLMGGYGRGEGAVLIRNGIECVFNDYDFFLVTKKKLNSEQKKVISEVADHLTNEIGIDIDLFPIDKKSFTKFPLSLMSYEMKVKSHIPYGNQAILNSLPDYNVSNLSELEGTRLLLNRGILLIYCKNILENQQHICDEEVEKIIKYIFKALLAVGDSYLLINKIYHHGMAEKKIIISEHSNSGFLYFEQLRDMYLEAIEFKTMVDYKRYKNRILHKWLRDTIKLYECYYHWYEEQRLNKSIADWRHYRSLIISESLKTPPTELMKNILINLKTFGPWHTMRHPVWALAYPRHRLYAMLPRLLFESDNKYSRSAFLLNKSGESDFQAVFKAYWKLWLKYS